MRKLRQSKKMTKIGLRCKNVARKSHGVHLFAYAISVGTNRAQAQPVYQLAVFFYAIASLVELILWIYLFALRFSHPGQVCSGDFLSRSKPSDHYVTSHGTFIKVIAILVVSSCLCLCCMGPYLSKRRKKRQLSTQRSVETF